MISECDGRVEYEVGRTIRVLWKENVSVKVKQKFRTKILNEHPDKLIADWKRVDGGAELCDLLGLVSLQFELEEFKDAILARYNTRNSSISWKSDKNQVVIRQDIDKLSLFFWDDQRKFLAQGSVNALHKFANIFYRVVGEKLSTPCNELRSDEFTWCLSEEQLQASQENVAMELSDLDLDSSPAEIRYTTPTIVLTPKRPQSVTVPSRLDESLSPTDPDSLSLPSNFESTNAKIIETQQKIMESLFSVIEELKEIKSSVSRLDTLENTMLQLKSENKVLSDRIRDLSGRVLIAEENLAAADKIGVDSRSVTKTSVARILKLEATLELVTSSIITPPVNEIALPLPLPDYLSQESIANEVKRIVGDSISAIKPLAPVSTNISSTRAAGPPDRKSAENHRKTFRVPKCSEITTAKFDSDVILLMDSNGQGINESILMNGLSCQRFYCPTLPDAMNLVKRATITKPARKIYIQIGTNDIEHNNPSEVGQELDALSYALSNAFPNAKIFVSAILARRDLSDKRDNANKLFEQLCAKYSSIMQFVAHENLSNPSVLSDGDTKHLHGGGFWRLLSNIRFALFGVIPRQRR